MQSVISYPNRGKWGDSKYRGNCSGHVIVDLVNHFNPKLFVDACMGSGTSRDVCNEMGIPYVGLDLHQGNDYTKDFILNQLPHPADMVFSHPAYHNMIQYSGNMYGKALAEDHSRCPSVDEFLEKSHVMLMNQREATVAGGIYTTLIGDMRKSGTFRSFQADFIKMMPSMELVSVVIKKQHNTTSGNRQYSGSFVPIMHEYLLIWKKSAQSLFAISMAKASEASKQVASTWRVAIRIAMMKIGTTCSLSHIYAEVEKVAGHLIANNANWKAKIRQKLQRHFTHVERGVWAV